MKRIQFENITDGSSRQMGGLEKTVLGILLLATFVIVVF
jgi:hypothetical protein